MEANFINKLSSELMIEYRKIAARHLDEGCLQRKVTDNAESKVSKTKTCTEEEATGRTVDLVQKVKE